MPMPQQEEHTLSTEDAVHELIRLRELDELNRVRVEAELRGEIDALWLRVSQLQRRRTWFSSIFN